MKVRLYSGAVKLIEKSGVGQAVLHQREMLRRMGIETTTKNDRDAVLVHMNTVFPDSFLAALLAKLRGQKVIYYGHSTMEDFRNSFLMSNLFAPVFKQWITLCYSMGDAVITPTEYSRRLLLGYGIQKPIYALSNGIDTDYFRFDSECRRRFRQKYHLSETDRAILSVGLMIQRKGILDFIELARRMPEEKFFWFGYTNLNLVPETVRKAIADAPPNLVFPGYVNQETLRDAYCGCDLFCFMSYEETEGIVVLEALSCQIPTLIRDIPVYDGWLEDGRNVYKGQDMKTFCKQARDILSGNAKDLTEAGRSVAEKRSISMAAKCLLKIYKKVLAIQ